jgi:hypothetical protein
VGYRVRSPRGVQFRRWASTILKEYLAKGFVMDDERLKNPDGRPDYFDEMLARIRDIRASEKRFYQKVRDLFALSSDYDKTDKATQVFFATVQNLLIYAVTQKTAAELITARANPADPHFGLLAWKGDKVRKTDIVVAKNYLTEDEIDTLNRLVVIFLETAELRAKSKQETRMAFWKQNVDQIITSNGFPLLTHAGTISHEQMEARTGELYQQFDQDRKRQEAIAADQQDEAEALENALKRWTTGQDPLGHRRPLRGAMNADDFRDYMLAFLFLRYLSDNYERRQRRSWGRTIQKRSRCLGDGRTPLRFWYEENAGRRTRVRKADAPQGALRDRAAIPVGQHRRDGAHAGRRAAAHLAEGLQVHRDGVLRQHLPGPVLGDQSGVGQAGQDLCRAQCQAVQDHQPRSPRGWRSSPPTATRWAMPMNT